MYPVTNGSYFNLKLIILALITGIIRKIYDEVVDEKKIYNANSNLIQIISYLFLILASLLLYFDNSFMLLLIIYIISNFFHLILHKYLGYKYENVFDTTIMKLLVIIVIILGIIKHQRLQKYFSKLYNIIIFICAFIIIFIEMGMSFPSGQSKIMLRILFCIFILFFAWSNPQYLLVVFYLVGYMSTSILSILYINS